MFYVKCRVTSHRTDVYHLATVTKDGVICQKMNCASVTQCCRQWQCFSDGLGDVLCHCVDRNAEVKWLIEHFQQTRKKISVLFLMKERDVYSDDR